MGRSFYSIARNSQLNGKSKVKGQKAKVKSVLLSRVARGGCSEAPNLEPIVRIVFYLPDHRSPFLVELWRLRDSIQCLSSFLATRIAVWGKDVRILEHL